MKLKLLAGASVLGAVLMTANTAQAQNVLGGNSRGQAAALYAGGGYGFAGGGRLDLEYQRHFGGSYQGAGLGLGLTLPLWGGWALGFEGRFMYDIQPIAGTAFFITPYIGASLGFWGCWSGNGSGCNGAFWVGPEAGLDFKVILFDRLILGLRLPGLSVPLVFAPGGVGIAWNLYGAFNIGVTF